MRHKLPSPEGRALYKQRKAIVEPVFGQLKEVRGFRRLLLRGLSAASGEFNLIALTHNLLKLFRFAADSFRLMKQACEAVVVAVHAEVVEVPAPGC